MFSHSRHHSVRCLAVSFLTILTLGSALALIASPAWALGTPSHWSPPNGDRVFFKNVTSEAGLFGSPSFTQDALHFDPGGRFETSCSQCPDEPVLRDRFSVDIMTENPFGLAIIRVEQQGQLVLNSVDPVGFAFASFSSAVLMRIWGSDARQLAPVEVALQMVFSPNSLGVVIEQGFESTLVQGELEIMPQELLASAGFNGFATRVHLEIDATISVFHQGVGGDANVSLQELSIGHRFFRCLSCDDPDPPLVMPEPSPAVFVLGGLAWLSRRRRPPDWLTRVLPSTCPPGSSRPGSRSTR